MDSVFAGDVEPLQMTKIETLNLAFLGLIVVVSKQRTQARKFRAWV
jgi:hypothetical protein